MKFQAKFCARWEYQQFGRTRQERAFRCGFVKNFVRDFAVNVDVQIWVKTWVPKPAEICLSDVESCCSKSISVCQHFPIQGILTHSMTPATPTEHFAKAVHNALLFWWLTSLASCIFQVGRDLSKVDWDYTSLFDVVMPHSAMGVLYQASVGCPNHS